MEKNRHYVANGILMKALRESKGLTVLQVTKQVKTFTRQFVYRIEDGSVSLPANAVKQMAKIYGVPALALTNLYAATKFNHYLEKSGAE